MRELLSVLVLDSFQVGLYAVYQNQPEQDFHTRAIQIEDRYLLDCTLSTEAMLWLRP